MVTLNSAGINHPMYFGSLGDLIPKKGELNNQKIKGSCLNVPNPEARSLSFVVKWLPISHLLSVHPIVF